MCVFEGERDRESERAMEGDVEMAAAAAAEEDGAAVVCDIRFLSQTLYFRVNFAFDFVLSISETLTFL